MRRFGLFGLLIATACNTTTGVDLGGTADSGAQAQDAGTSDIGAPPKDMGNVPDAGVDLGPQADLGPAPDTGVADMGQPDTGVDAGGTDVGAMDAGTPSGDPWEPSFTASGTYQVTVAPYGDPADVYYPTVQGAAAPGTFPAIVLLQGANVERGFYSQYAQLVAQFGFIVIVPDHTRTVLVLTGLFPEVDLLTASLDTLALENQNANAPIQGHVDTSRSGVLGHSLGGVAGLEAIANECSNQLCTSNSYTRPSSLRAGVFYGTNRKPPIGNNIPTTTNAGLPILLLQGDLDGAANIADTRTTYDRIADPPKAFGVLQGGNHFSVTDDQNPPGSMPDNNTPTVPQAAGIDILGRWTGTFLNAHVKDDSRARDYVYMAPAQPEPNFALESIAASMATGPEAQGSCAYTTSSFSISGTNGNLGVKVYLPSNGSAPYPVVVFNPGLRISEAEYAAKLNHLASWCYAVVANETVYSPFSVDDNAWTQDILDMIGWVSTNTEPALSGQLGTQLTLLGHSAGAKNGFRAARLSSAVDAVVAWDVAGMNPPTNPGGVDSLTVPVLLLGETWSGNNAIAGQFCAPLESNFEVYYAALPSGLPVLSVNMALADHISFLDDRSCGLSCTVCPANSSADPQDTTQKIRRYTLSWLERFIRSDTSFDTYLFGADMAQDEASGAVSTQTK